MATIVFIILQIFFATRAVSKIGEYLTIRLRARVFYKQIVNEAQPSWLSLVENEGSSFALGKLFASRKTVRFSEQIMSADKYPSIFSRQMATIVFIILQILFARRAVLKIGEYSRIFPSFGWGIFGHVTRLGQSRVSKKI